jgi:ATP-dependent DNA helicase RecQ
MSVEAKKILTAYWGHSEFRPMQEEIIDSVLGGNDTLALLPTGGGKSVCFQVPALIKEGTCIVITPLIALMKDQVANLKKMNIKAAAIYSGMHRDEVESVYSNALAGNLKFIYISPERLATPVTRNVIGRMKVSILAIDEAHCISQWGYDFRPPYLKISEIRPIIPNVPVLALTATATPIVVTDIMKKLEFKRDNALKTSFERRNLSYNVYKEFDKTGFLIRKLKEVDNSAIIYVRSRRKTRELAEVLDKNGISATYYHAGLDAKMRDNRQKDWTLGRVKVIVATNAFGMGIDKANVRNVVHYDLPDSVESYFQEAGRAGRDLQPSAATLLYNSNDIVNVKDRLNSSFPPMTTIQAVYNAIGNYFQIPEGTGKDMGFNFDISDFSSNYNFNILHAYNSIKFLEREGFLLYIQSAGQYSKLFVPLNKSDLYTFIVNNPGSDRLLKEIMRSYSGIFTDYININETLLAKRAEMMRENVIKKLIYFDRQKVISYIPIKVKPQLVFSYERLSAKHIQLSDENYKNLKESSEKRLEAMLNFVTNSIDCRSSLLLEYFGEKKVRRCGICDVCVAKNKADLNEIEFDSIQKLISISLKKNPKHLFELISSVDGYEEDDIIQVVRWLIDNGKVIRHNDETLSWYKQLDLGFD